LTSQNTDAYYWSQTELNTTNGRSLFFDFNGIIFPQNTFTNKTFGFALRCVRDLGLTDDSLITLNCAVGAPQSGAFLIDSIKWGGNPMPETFVTVAGQYWTDAVTVGGTCNKTTYSSGMTPGTFSTDCRNSEDNVNFHGHYYSWCFVKRYEEFLCPAPLCVLDRTDF